ncbi:MAG: invasion associated locus B family protein [Desulfococcaceae bacterium]
MKKKKIACLFGWTMIIIAVFQTGCSSAPVAAESGKAAESPKAGESRDKEEVYQDWALHFSSENSAWVLEQRIFIEGNEKTPLVHMAFRKMETDKGREKADLLWAVLKVPLGILLDSGLQLQTDEDKPMTVSLHHCAATGCMALWPLQPDLRKKLETGKAARVTFQLINGQRVGVPVSLSGLKAGLSALDKKPVKKSAKQK